MRILYNTVIILLLNSFTLAQTADVIVENGRKDGTLYKFDIYLNRTSSWGEDAAYNYLGDASFRFTKNSAAFDSSPLITAVGTHFQNSDYLLTTQTLQGQINIEVNFLDQGAGSILEMGTKYFLCTVAQTILDENQFALIGWVPISTALFNGSDENVKSTLLGNLEDDPVPVELTSFTAETIKTKKVLLNWQTATEVNNYGFDVERKSNSNDWEKLGFVEGHGNSNSPKHYSFEDNNIVGGSDFTYRLKQIDFDGSYEYSDELECEVLPLQNKLFQNYPNPFNPTTKIKFSLVEPEKVSIKIYNTLGEIVHTAASRTYDVGFHELEFDGTNLVSGIYFYEIQINDYYDTKKMILIK